VDASLISQLLCLGSLRSFGPALTHFCASYFSSLWGWETTALVVIIFNMDDAIEDEQAGCEGGMFVRGGEWNLGRNGKS